MQDVIFFIILGILAMLSLVVVFLTFYCFALNKRLNRFCKGDKGNLEEFLGSQAEKLEKQGADIKEVFEEISKLQRVSKRTFQKIGLVRFNPFKEVGGNQSFSIAVLDAQNNGFVITGLYERERNRIYAKPVEQGASKYPLSEEEKRAIGEAISA